MSSYESEHAPFTMGQATVDEETGDLHVSWMLTELMMSRFKLDSVDIDPTGSFFTMKFERRNDGLQRS